MAAEEFDDDLDDLIACVCAQHVVLALEREEMTRTRARGRNTTAPPSYAALQQLDVPRAVRLDQWEHLAFMPGESFRRRLRLTPAQFKFVAGIVGPHPDRLSSSVADRSP